MSSRSEDNSICDEAIKIQDEKDLLVVLNSETPHAFALLPSI